MVGAALARLCPSRIFRSNVMSVVSEDLEPLPFVFDDDGLVPNNPLPFLVYKGAIDVGNNHPEKTIEGLFGANGWGDMWRDGVYDYLHYHATVHEALGIARGHARVRFGGDAGQEFELSAGDVAISAGRHRPSMPFGEPGFLGGRRLSAGRENARHAADAGELPQGAQDDSRGPPAANRSASWCGWAAGEAVE
jgi:hypothetical protein